MGFLSDLVNSFRQAAVNTHTNTSEAPKEVNKINLDGIDWDKTIKQATSSALQGNLSTPKEQADSASRAVSAWLKKGADTKEEQRKAVLDSADKSRVTDDVQGIYKEMYGDNVDYEENGSPETDYVAQVKEKYSGLAHGEEPISDVDYFLEQNKDPQSDLESIRSIKKNDLNEYIDDQNSNILSHYASEDDLGMSELGNKESGQKAYESKIDDGNMSIENLTSEKMTIGQYIKQREAGIPGRPLEELYRMYEENPNLILSKVDEQRQYGYQPYWTNQFDEIKRQGTKLAEYPSDLANNLANARSNADYTNYINGKLFSGKEVDKKAKDYFTQTADQVNDTSRWSIDPDEDHTGMTGYKLGYKVLLDDGSEVELSDDSPEFYPGEDGTLTVHFPKDNKTFQFDNEEDYDKNLQENWDFAGEGDTPLAWVKFDDLTLDDGTVLTFDEVREHVNGGGNPDYGFLNWAKPAERTQDFITENGFNFEDLVPKMADITLSSVPYFHPTMSVPLAISNMVKAAQGLDPRKKDDDKGTYSALSEHMTPEIEASAILGNAIMPATEIGLGRIGGKMVEKPLEGIARRYGERAWMPGAEWALGSVGEGLEEVPSNLVEDWMVYGPKGLYANAITDDEGNKQYDSSGHELRDENTSMFDRAGNFIADIPEAFIGGALLGSGFGIPEIPSTIADTQETYQRNKADIESGAGIFKEIRPQDVYKRMTEEELYKNRK